MKLANKIALLIVLGLFLAYPSVGIAPAASQSASVAYDDAKRAYLDLIEDSGRVKFRHNWKKVIRGFERVVSASGNDAINARARYMIGQCYEQLYTYSLLSDDAREAIAAYEKLAEKHPKNRLADDGLYHNGEIYENALGDSGQAYLSYKRIVDDFSSGDMVRKARAKVNELAAHKPAPPTPPTPVTPAPAPAPLPVLDPPAHTIIGLRHWSNPTYTRIVIDTSGEVKFTSHLLKADPNLGKPPRLYLDIDDATLDPTSVPTEVPINDSLLKRVRLARNTLNSVRVVLDIETIKRYRVFALPDPARIVIDVVGTESPSSIEQALAAARGSGAPVPVVPTPSTGGSPAVTLAGQLGLRVKRIVIDPGHGGKDPGAIGCSGTYEKKIVLAISKKVAKILRERGYEVILTRETDKYLRLEERTAIANTNRADLFVSIHANAARNKRAHGIETYYLSLATDEESVRVAARENATSSRKMSDLQLILQDLMTTSKVNESTLLAGYVQESMVTGIRDHFTKVKDLGVKRAPFFVLIGAEMPCLLVETGFMSNPEEERRLRSGAYQDQLARSIAEGIEKYSNQLKVSSY
jgi:N-acetylmuramoyl-L-alanine amidase